MILSGGVSCRWWRQVACCGITSTLTQPADSLDHHVEAWDMVERLSVGDITQVVIDSDLHDHTSTEKKASRLCQESVEDARASADLAEHEVVEIELECVHHSYSNTGSAGVVALGRCLCSEGEKEVTVEGEMVRLVDALQQSRGREARAAKRQSGK